MYSRDLSLHQNRWLCDCHLLELHHWLRNSTAVPQSEEPRCRSPQRLSGEKIAATPSSEFACKPEVAPTTKDLEVIEGKNMSLGCTIKVSLSQSRLTANYNRPQPFSLLMIRMVV